MPTRTPRTIAEEKGTNPAAFEKVDYCPECGVTHGPGVPAHPRASAAGYAANPVNPDPNVWVGYGDRTVDEMAHAWVNVTYLSDEDYAAEVEARRRLLSSATQQQQD